MYSHNFITLKIFLGIIKYKHMIRQDEKDRVFVKKLDKVPPPLFQSPNVVVYNLPYTSRLPFGSC
jgi:hypothetical protein